MRRVLLILVLLASALAGAAAWWVGALATSHPAMAEVSRVLGGVRTNEYDNAIRVDNVQHSLMGLQKLLADIAAGNSL